MSVGVHTCAFHQPITTKSYKSQSLSHFIILQNQSIFQKKTKFDSTRHRLNTHKQFK